jgi:hypothetical protein
MMEGESLRERARLEDETGPSALAFESSAFRIIVSVVDNVQTHRGVTLTGKVEGNRRWFGGFSAKESAPSGVRFDPCAFLTI